MQQFVGLVNASFQRGAPLPALESRRSRKRSATFS
jgi:hypothetical protein